MNDDTSVLVDDLSMHVKKHGIPKEALSDVERDILAADRRR